MHTDGCCRHGGLPHSSHNRRYLLGHHLKIPVRRLKGNGPADWGSGYYRTGRKTLEEEVTVRYFMDQDKHQRSSKTVNVYASGEHRGAGCHIDLIFSQVIVVFKHPGT